MRPAACRHVVVMLLVAVACSTPPKKKEAGDRVAKDELDLELEAKQKVVPKAIDPCAPSQLGLGAARPVTPWAAPAECSARSGPPGPATVTSEAQFAERFACPKGTASGIDFATQQLVVEDRTLSPAGAGTTIVDDGAKITFIERARSPCPNDPLPMPIAYTLGFLLPKGAKRTFANTGCTLPPSC